MSDFFHYDRKSEKLIDFFKLNKSGIFWFDKGLLRDYVNANACMVSSSCDREKVNKYRKDQINSQEKADKSKTNYSTSFITASHYSGHNFVNGKPSFEIFYSSKIKEDEKIKPKKEDSLVEDESNTDSEETTENTDEEENTYKTISKFKARWYELKLKFKHHEYSNLSRFSFHIPRLDLYVENLAYFNKNFLTEKNDWILFSILNKVLNYDQKNNEVTLKKMNYANIIRQNDDDTAGSFKIPVVSILYNYITGFFAETSDIGEHLFEVEPKFIKIKYYNMLMTTSESDELWNKKYKSVVMPSISKNSIKKIVEAYDIDIPEENSNDNYGTHSLQNISLLSVLISFCLIKFFQVKN
jgi:hypothetical protein